MTSCFFVTQPVGYMLFPRGTVIFFNKFKHDSSFPKTVKVILLELLV